MVAIVIGKINKIITICTDFIRILVCWCIVALPSLSAIKCTLIGNKTANINDTNCSLSTVLKVTHQKLQKS